MPTPTPTPTVAPTPFPTTAIGPQIVNPIDTYTSNSVNFTITGITGSDVWIKYGQNPSGYTWITTNYTAAGGVAVIQVSGYPMFGSTRYYATACDMTGACGNEVTWTTTTITPMPTTTYGAAFKRFIGMR